MSTRRVSADPKYPVALRISVREAQILHSMVEYVAARVHDVDISHADRESLRDVAAQLDCELRFLYERNPAGFARSS